MNNVPLMLIFEIPKMSTMRRISVLFLLIFPVLLVLICPLQAQQLPVDPGLTIGKLQNGLTYYIRENALPKDKVELRLVLNAGSINEDDDQQGLAHMAEHMAFNGTTNFKKNEIISYLQDIGVGFGNDLNAYTSFNETVYILPIPLKDRKNLDIGFQILEDWAHNVTYNTDDIEGERAIILEESRAGKGANDRMFRKIYPKLFEGSKYAERLPIGRDSIIKTFNPDAIRRYYKDWYRPDLMAVIVVGDIKKAEAEALIKKHFSKLKNPKKARERKIEPLHPYSTTEALLVTDAEATGYSVAINYPAEKVTPATNETDYRNDLVENLFSSMFNQRLQELSQQENAPFLGGFADYTGITRGYEFFSLNAAVGTGDPEKALVALATEMARVARYGFTASELERVKKSSMNNYERAYNNRDKTESSELTEEYIRHFLDQEPVPGIATEFELVKKMLPGITLEEVNAIAGKYAADANRFVYVMGPEKGSASLPDADKLINTIAKAEAGDIKPYEEKVVSAELLPEAPIAGKVVRSSKDELLGTTELVLSNGVTVTLKPTDFKNDQIVMGATRPGGKNHYGIKDKFNAEYAVQVVSTMGVGDFSPVDLRKALAGKSASVSPVFSAVSEGVRGTSGKKDLETLLQLTHLYFTSPRKDTALFNSFIQKNKSQFANISSNPQAAFVDTLYKVYYQHNPLAPVTVPHSSFFDKIDLDRALEIYRARFGNAYGMNFVFVGSFEAQELIPLIEKYLGSLPADQKQFTYTDNNVKPLPGEKKLVVNRGAEQKSLILGFYSGEVAYSEDLDLKIQAMSEILNIRIIEELREKVQGIYGGGTFAGLEKIPRSTYSFVLQLPCGPEKVDTLLRAVQHEFDLLVRQGPEESYLNKVKQQWKEQYKTGIRENNTWLSQILEYKLQGGDPKRFINYEQQVDKLTPADVQEAAKIVLGGENRFTAVLMPEKPDTR